MRQQRILPRDALPRDDRLASGRQAPSARPERAIHHASILDLGQEDNAVGLDFDILFGDRCEQGIGCFLGKGLEREALEGARPINVRLGGLGERLIGEALGNVADGLSRLGRAWGGTRSGWGLGET